MLNQRSDKVELLRIADAVAAEKSIDKEIILSSMESAIQKAAKTRFGAENNIRAIIDRETGEIFFGRVPAYSVVVPGTVSTNKPENFSQDLNLYCAVIVKKVDEKTRSKTSINELLRS